MRRVAWLGLLAPALLSAQQRHYSLDDASKLVSVSSPQIAPDGKSVAFVAERANYETNGWDAQLIVLDIASGAQRVLVQRRDVSSPRWSPAGDRIGFLSTADGLQQVLVVAASGGELQTLTRASRSVRQFAWRPDGSEVAYIVRDTGSTPADRYNNSFEIGDDPYTISAAPVASHLWVGDRRLTRGDWSLATSLSTSLLSWSADGRTIAVVRFATPHSGDTDQSTIWLVDVDSGAARPLTTRRGREGPASFSPDGRLLAYTYPRHGDPANLDEIWVAPAAGGEGRVVNRGIDRHVLELAWLPGSAEVLMLGTDGTTSSLWVQPVEAGGPARRIALGDVVAASELTVSPAGAIAFVGGERGRAAEIYYLASAGAAPRRLTDFNGPSADQALGSSEHVEWSTYDGMTADGVLTTPPGFSSGTRYPLVLLIHGGPTASSTEEFYARAQLLAAEGWLVFQPNYRGSDNRGNAFQRAIAVSAAEGPGRDVMAGVRTLIRRGIVDTARMAVSGWSYGGYMTAWLLGRYPNKWRAAVAGAAPISLFDMYNLSDLNVMRRHAITASPWVGDHVQAWLEESPLKNVWKIRAPTLIMSNTADARVAVTGSYTLYRALKDNKVPVQFIGYPGPGHSPGDPVRSRDVNRRWIEWLKTYLR